MLSGSPSAATWLIALLAAPLVSGQSPQATITGPNFGFVYDGISHAVKPLVGNPAAGAIGPAAPVGWGLATAAISPRQDFALAVARDGGSVLLARLDGGNPATSVLDALAEAPDRLALSPGGGTAALYYAATQNIQVVTGLPDAPVFSSLDAEALPKPPDVLAVSDDGQAVLAGVNGAGAGQVYVLAGGGTAQAVFAAGRVAAMAFLHGSRDALVADGAANLVVRLTSLEGSPRASVLARQTNGIAGPVAVTASADNGAALVANADSSSVAVIDLAGGTTTVTACLCVPTTVAALRSPGVFRLNDVSGQPMTLVEIGGVRPVMTIIPPEVKQNAPRRIRIPEREVRQ
ncbi:MAG TPA: hypothetical protein VFA33_20770 [Bryobacteraceae bacterium]|nr:hypothetical protein [Bryobacteraceae bacterium]